MIHKYFHLAGTELLSALLMIRRATVATYIHICICGGPTAYPSLISSEWYSKYVRSKYVSMTVVTGNRFFSELKDRGVMLRDY